MSAVKTLELDTRPQSGYMFLRLTGLQCIYATDKKEEVSSGDHQQNASF
jgi:hypothetical protein